MLTRDQIVEKAQPIIKNILGPYARRNRLTVDDQHDIANSVNVYLLGLDWDKLQADSAGRNIDAVLVHFVGLRIRKEFYELMSGGYRGTIDLKNIKEFRGRTITTETPLNHNPKNHGNVVTLGDTLLSKFPDAEEELIRESVGKSLMQRMEWLTSEEREFLLAVAGDPPTDSNREQWAADLRVQPKDIYTMWQKIKRNMRKKPTNKRYKRRDNCTVFDFEHARRVRAERSLKEIN